MTLHRGYDLPNSQRKPGDIPVISSSGISGSHSVAKLDGENVITGRYGTIGEVFYHNGPCWPLNTTLYVEDFHGNDPKYTAYLLEAMLDALKIDGADKSTVPGVDRNVLHDLTVPYISDLACQKSTTHVLTVIDAKIANNNKLIQELEDTAQLIYDYWFTQFDFPGENGRPYLSSGGKMLWSDELKREIPEGWLVVNLYGIADFINGLACQNHRPKGTDTGLPVIKIREMHDGVTADTERVSSSIPARNIIKDGDMLFAWSASLEVQYWNGGVAGLNQHIFKVEPKPNIPAEFVYQQLIRYLVVFKRMAEVRKTTMGHITSDHLDQSRVVLPPIATLQKFDSTTRAIRSSIIQLGQQNRELIQLRDWLLPMLMNGQVIIE